MDSLLRFLFACKMDKERRDLSHSLENHDSSPNLRSVPQIKV